MAKFYKKRRRTSAGPSKNEEKVLRRKEGENPSRTEGLLRLRYPSVAQLTIHLEFFSPHQHILGQETRQFVPSDACLFTASCPGQCGVGIFDLAEKIDRVILAKETISTGSAKCQQPLFAGSMGACGCELKGKIEVAYLPEPAK